MEVSRPLSRQAWHSRSQLIRSRSRPLERSPSVACVCATRLRLGTCSGDPVGREPQTCSRSAPRDAGCGVRARPPPTVWFEPCVRVVAAGWPGCSSQPGLPVLLPPEIPPQRDLPSPNRAGPRRPEGTSSKGVNRSMVVVSPAINRRFRLGAEASAEQAPDGCRQGLRVPLQRRPRGWRASRSGLEVTMHEHTGVRANMAFAVPL